MKQQQNSGTKSAHQLSEKLENQTAQKSSKQIEEEDIDFVEPPSEEILGKRPAQTNENQPNPLNALMMLNHNQSHNTQRRRDIKQNYKAKLPLDKLIIEHDKKKQQLIELMDKRENIKIKIKTMWQTIGQRKGVNLDLDINDAPNTSDKIQIDNEDQTGELVDQTEIYKRNQGKCHWDYLLKELEWMADDFGKETKKKHTDSKKMVKLCKKYKNEQAVKLEKDKREMKIDLKRKSKFMANIVQMYWKSCEKIVKHNYNIEYERKRQAQRTKKLENFVSKHLKLSVKMSEQLNTKKFVEQSQYRVNENDEKKVDDPSILHVDDGQKQIKIYDSQENIEMKHLDKEKTISNQDQENSDIAPNFAPTGTDLDHAVVNTKVPFLLKGTLREYQIIGLDWMMSLHNRKLNGILADEMGLGKTIQTIALLASLACDKGVWGPHLIVVPTTIIMNWEMEFKKWCPGFKILTYFGSQKERKIKRHGWSKDNSFHICITSYKLVIQDHFAFRRKKWYYMILDEAQNIKNFKSQRWQTMLRFNSKRRLLLTGTPLQNDVMELWSLMHFLMPNIFANMQDFKEWFSNPFSQSVNHNKSLNLRVVQKLQSILRPFLLRRMKRDVEKQLPEKIEHIVQCNLSRRQRLLYDEYINLDNTRNTLADSDFFSIMSVLMQLRKVCNHPDLFEARSIESPFILTDQERIKYSFPTQLLKELQFDTTDRDVNLSNMSLKLIDMEDRARSVTVRQQELLPTEQMEELFLKNQSLVGPNQNVYENNNFSSNHTSSRPFFDTLAVGKKTHTNQNILHKGNCGQLKKTIPSIMPYDINNNYKMQYHNIPRYLNAACLPFCQDYFSMSSYDQVRYSTFDNGLYNPIKKYTSALQGEEQRQQMIRLARKLALWHSIDRQNRLQILNGQPLYGKDLRQLIEVKLVCQDIFEPKRFKYVNWKRVNEDPGSVDKIYSMAQAVFNPCCGYNKQDNVIVSDWPNMSESQIDLINSKNLFIKEITCQTLQQIKANKEKRDHEEKMRQPKKVQRQKVEEVSFTTNEFNIYINTQNLNTENDYEMNPNVYYSEETITHTKTEIKNYDEIITYQEYLDEQQISIQSPDKEIEIDEKSPEIMSQNEQKSEDEVCDTSKLSIGYKNTDVLQGLIVSPMQRASSMEEIVKNFKIIIPKVVSKPVEFIPSKIYTKNQKDVAYERFLHQKLMQHKNVNQSLKYSNILFFPHRNLIQYDCGKLQKMAQLLKTLYNKGSKVVIFTQMTKMLDIFEQFLNLHGYIYVRLDGSVKTENRQKLVDRFNYNKKIFCFIASTRCGGVGINLTGANCVIFYDTDWNPSMDKQAQDRCHRIGQTKTVHIYRLISINTIEENIFKKSLQKRELGGLIIEGNFNQEFFQKVSVKDILTMDESKEFRPKRLDIFKNENIVFGQDDPEENENGEVTEKDIKVEQYKKRFEDVLMRIEDQEDVDAMQDANREINDNDNEDLHEFDENQPTGEGEAPKEDQGKQKVCDGISLTQNDIKKHETVQWDSLNSKLNMVTRQCLEYTQRNYTFDEYLDERSKKDPKFVNINDENAEEKEQSGSDNQSEFSFSEDDQESTQLNSTGGLNKQNAWDRQTAEQSFLNTRLDIDTRLVQNNQQVQFYTQENQEMEEEDEKEEVKEGESSLIN